MPTQSAPIFSWEQTKQLAEIAGRSHPQRSEVSPPEQRAVLKVLINHSHRLLEGLQETKFDTKRAIYSGYPNLCLVDHEA